MPPLSSPVPPELLRAALEATGRTQRSLADDLDIAPATLNRWATGRQPLSVASWAACAAGLGLPLTWQPGGARPRCPHCSRPLPKVTDAT